MMYKIQNSKGKISMIIVLLIVIVILAIILGLEVSGIIDFSKKDNSSTTIIEQQEANEQKEIHTDDYYREKQLEYLKEKQANSLKELNKKRNSVVLTSNIIGIILFIIAVVLNIGVCKLYNKLNLPSFVVKFWFIWPFLSYISTFLPKTLGTILEIISFALALITLWYYFRAVGMSSWWAFLPLCAIIPFIGLVGIIAFLIAFIISNVKLGQKFEKSIIFIVGLAILPFIFQPILGYAKD